MGQWPKDVAIVRITRIVVYTGAIVDSVRVTYLLTNSQSITVQHGGTGGKVALDFTLSGKFYASLGVQILLTRLELQLLRKLLLFMVAGSMVLVRTARKSMCLGLLTSLLFNARDFVIQHSPVVVHNRNEWRGWKGCSYM